MYSGTKKKNWLRIFQPTLGFLSAIGGKYGNYDRWYPQVLNGLVLKGFRKEVERKKIGPEKLFQAQPSKTELRARHSSMPGLESSFWHDISFRKELARKNDFLGTEKFFQVQPPKTELRARQGKPGRAKGSPLGQKLPSESELVPNFSLASSVWVRFPLVWGKCLLLACWLVIF